MPRKRRGSDLSIRPSDGAMLALDRGLAAIAATSAHAFARRSGRVALTFRRCASGTDALGDGYVALDSWRLLALGYRLTDDGRGGLRKRAPLAIYRPRVDLPGTGRIRFDCTAVFDLAARAAPAGPVLRLDARRHLGAARAAVAMHEAIEDTPAEAMAAGPVLPCFYWAFNPKLPPFPEPTFTPEEWAAAEARIDELRAWPAEMFARHTGLRYDLHPIDGSPDPWPPASGPWTAPTGKEAHGAWIRRGGIAIPLAQQPEAIFASLAHLRGRSVRDPAIAALRRAGLIPRDANTREWLAAFRRPGPCGGHPAAAGLRERVAAYGAARPGAEQALLADVGAGSEAAGVAMPADAEGRLQFLAGLVMDPDRPVDLPEAGAIQVVRLADPGATAFAGDVAELDLGDLGDDAPLYAPLEPDDVSKALREGRSRNSPRRSAIVMR